VGGRHYMNMNLTRGVAHCVALPFTLKKYLKAKEEFWKLKYFTIAKTIIFKKKNPLKETKKTFKIYYNSIITNLKFQHKPKYNLSKNLV
jgi:hypothetical protein